MIDKVMPSVCPLCGERHPDHCPDERQVATLAAEIRSKWTPQEHLKRLQGYTREDQVVEVLEVGITPSRVMRKIPGSSA